MSSKLKKMLKKAKKAKETNEELYPKLPLNLPRGSVRAILAIIVLVGGFTYLLIYKDVLTEIYALLGVVIGYYYGRRDIESKP